MGDSYDDLEAKTPDVDPNKMFAKGDTVTKLRALIRKKDEGLELAKSLIGFLMWVKGVCVHCGRAEHRVHCRMSKDAGAVDSASSLTE